MTCIFGAINYLRKIFPAQVSEDRHEVPCQPELQPPLLHACNLLELLVQLADEIGVH